MNKRFLFALFLMLGILSFLSCGKDDATNDPCSTAWATELNDEAQAMSNALQTYLNDPTTANCEAYKSAAQAYLNALRPYGNCAALVGQQRVDWQNAVDAAQEGINNIEC